MPTLKRQPSLGAIGQWVQRQARDGDGQVLLSLIAMGSLTALWTLLWPVPTEVVGRGVVIVPGGATVLDSRAEGQIRELTVKVGDRVKQGQLLMVLDQPALEKQLEQQQRDLRELMQINANLNRRDAERLQPSLHHLGTPWAGAPVPEAETARAIRRFLGLLAQARAGLQLEPDLAAALVRRSGQLRTQFGTNAV